jgi:DNA-binding transcriptional LysR family regulator
MIGREPKPQSALDGIDVNLLRLFCVIVESKGFSAAQARMNVSAASISNKMAALEARLGLRLCQRGRAGFRLTGEGECIYAAAVQIFRAHAAFMKQASDLCADLTGRLDIGIVDSTVTNAAMRLSGPIRRFCAKHPEVQLSIAVREPAEIERSLLAGAIQIGIAPFYHHVPGLVYRPLFEEMHELYCGHDHVLFDRAPDRVEPRELRTCKYVIRSHLPSAVELSRETVTAAATVTDMEAMAHLILSGQFIGFLPVHYAAVWTDRGAMRAILPGRYAHTSAFEVATNLERRFDRVTIAFLEEVMAQPES